MNVNLPELSAYAWLIEENAVRRFGTGVDAPMGDTFAREGLRVVQALSIGAGVAGRVVQQLPPALERKRSATPRLRVRWSHWKTDRAAVRGTWTARRTIG
jgi:hypothetical protein